MMALRCYIRQGPLPTSAFLQGLLHAQYRTMPGTAFRRCVWILREHGERERGRYRRVQYAPRMSGSMCSLCAVWQCAQPVTQTWRDNMSVREPAAITPLAAGTMDYTRVTFSVDIARFSKQTKKLNKDIVALWARRVLDVAGCNPGIKCFLNGRLVKVSSQLARTLFPLLA